MKRYPHCTCKGVVKGHHAKYELKNHTRFHVASSDDGDTCNDCGYYVTWLPVFDNMPSTINKLFVHTVSLRDDDIMRTWIDDENTTRQLHDW